VRSSLVVLAFTVACTKASDPASSTGSAGSAGSGSAAVAVKPRPVRDGIAIPANHPTTNILVTHHCSLSPHPPSTYFYSHVTVFDLEAATWTRTRTEGNEGPPQPHPPAKPGDPEPPDPNAPKVETTTGALAADRVATLRKHLADVLAGGPYPPKYPYSGGSRCTLILAAKGQEPFFSIDRADNAIDDAVTQLMTAL